MLNKINAMLELKNISFQTKSKTLLRSTSLKLNNKELIAIVGSNGAGKSTMMRCISGEHKPTTGNVFWKGKDIAEYSITNLAKERAMLTQANNVTTDFKVNQVIMVGRYPHYDYNPAATDIETVSVVINSQQLGPFSERSYNTLSGGEQQRVHLARVIAQLSEAIKNGEPWAKEKLLLLDEPLNNLDIRFQLDMLRSVKSFAESGNTVIAVLHDINLALHFAHKIILMKDGRVVAFGEPSEVINEENIMECFNIPCQILPVNNSDKKIIHFIN